MLKLNELIGKDLTRIMEENKASDYYIHTSLKLCSPPTLKHIKTGNPTCKMIPLNTILNIYKALGQKEVDIEDKKNTLTIEF